MQSHQWTRRFKPDKFFAPKGFRPLSDGVWAYNQLVLEIGAGNGRHAHHYAKMHPNHYLIAIERTKTKAYKLLNAHLPNLLAIHADAICYSVFALPPACLDRVYILYPNPEPKNPNQRFVNMPFFEFLLSRMKPNASLVLASNIGAYIDEACQVLDAIWYLPYSKKVIEPTSSRTNFEIKYLARAERCQELLITKPEYYDTQFDGFDKTNRWV